MSVAKIALIAAFVTLATVALYSHQAKTHTQTLSSEDSSLFSEFKAWKVQYNKPYGGAEETARFNVFKTNKANIAAHEAATPNRTYTLAVNQFADLTDEEFTAIYLGAVEEATTPAFNLKSTLRANSKTVDWRGSAVSPVKNQAQCGSCWAFSTITSLEGLQAITTGKLIALSEQQLVDCSHNGNMGCNGGLAKTAIQYAADTGVQSAESYPYTGVDGKCKFDASKVIYKNGGVAAVTPFNWQALENAIEKQVVSVSVQADKSPFRFYAGGVLNDVSCGTALNHAINAVGYTEDAWIIRNSWGPSWGESGYIRIAKGDQSNGAGICGVNTRPVYPTA